MYRIKRLYTQMIEIVELALRLQDYLLSILNTNGQSHY